MQHPLGVSSATGQSGLGLGMGGRGGGGGLNLNQTQTGMGLRLGGLGGQPTSMGIGLTPATSRPTALGLGTQRATGIGTGIGGTTGMGMGLGGTNSIGTGLGRGGMGTGLATSGMGTGLGTSGMGTGLGTSGLGTGLGRGIGTGLPTSGMGMGLGTGLATSGIGTGLGRGIGTGLATSGIGTGLGTSGIGAGLGRGGLGTGLATSSGIGTGLGRGGLGTGGIGMGLGAGLGGGGIGLPGPSATGLGGLSLAGTHKGPSQGIFTQAGAMGSQSNAQQQLINTQLMFSAITMPSLYGDERDLIIKKFNQLEAYCGCGKGVTAYGMVDFAPDNPFARFKTICYSRLPSAKNEDGLVTLHFKKSNSLLLQSQDTLTKQLQDIVAIPTVQVVIDSIKPLPDSCSEVTLYILEQSTLGSLGRVLATNAFIHLQNQSRKTQLESIGVTTIYPKTGFSEEELKMYLATPPAGITNEVWEQCKNENPDPQHYIPVAVVGSEELLKRIKYQDQECQLHEMRLKIMQEDMTELHQQQVTAAAKIAEYRRKLNDLSHRILKVMVSQEKYRKYGWSVQPVEEQLRGKLESILRELDSPTLLKGRLNEITSQLRMQGHTHHHHQLSNTSLYGNGRRSTLDPLLTSDIKDHLTHQQSAISEMIKIIKTDCEDLKLVEKGLRKMSTQLTA